MQRAPVSRGLRRISLPIWAIPALVTLILSSNCFQYPFLWDDFDFLGRAQHFSLGQLLPDPKLTFFRPLSREIYFGLIYALGPVGVIWAHVLNLAMLVAATALLTGLVARISGPRAGFLSGLIFATFGQVPQLAGFISCDQDLMAILLMLLALRLRLDERPMFALLAFAAALLAKETAIVAVPILIAFDWLLARKPYRVWLNLAAYGALTITWGAAHPGIRSLVGAGMHRTSGGYLAAGNSERLGSLLKGTVTLLNVPLSGFSTQWPADLNLPLLGALLLIAGSFLLLGYRTSTPTAERPIKVAHLIALGSVLLALPLILTSVMIGHWAPYYACFPSIGLAIVLGCVLGKRSFGLSAVAIALWAILGVWSRAAVIDPGVISERSLQPTAAALKRVERGFKSLHESLPVQAVACVSVQSWGERSVYAHIYRFQALRIWYRNPTLLTIRPDRRQATHGPEFLFWVSPSLDVFEIDPISLAHRPQGGRENFFEYQKVLRYYVQGLAASGDLDRAVSTLQNMPEAEPVVRNMDHRFAATLLFSHGRGREAQSILDGLPPLGRLLSLTAVGVFLQYYSPPGQILDEYVFRAFDIALDDQEAMRAMMVTCAENRRPDVALRLARRLLALKPGDSEADSIIGRLSDQPSSERLTVPISEDSP